MSNPWYPEVNESVVWDESDRVAYAWVVDVSTDRPVIGVRRNGVIYDCIWDGEHWCTTSALGIRVIIRRGKLS